MATGALRQVHIPEPSAPLRKVAADIDTGVVLPWRDEELHHQLAEDMHQLALAYECSDEEIARKLQMRYDGYHFSGKSPDIYNPYSLLSAFANKTISNYWFETGTPAFLIRMIKQFKFPITEMDDIEATDYSINRPTESMTTIVPAMRGLHSGCDEHPLQ